MPGAEWVIKPDGGQGVDLHDQRYLLMPAFVVVHSHVLDSYGRPYSFSNEPVRRSDAGRQAKIGTVIVPDAGLCILEISGR